MEETSAPPPTLTHPLPTNEDVVLHAHVHADDVVVPSLTDEEQETVVDKLEEVKDDFLPDFPPGYRFAPLDEELITHYLLRKIKDQPLPPNKIKEVNIYKFNPEDLAEKFKVYGEDEKEWYFFSPRDKKYPNGSRPNRAAGDGFWKATGADKKIERDGKEIGLRKALVFYRGKAPKGEKTNWIMHEYRTPDKQTPRMRSAGLHNMQLDKFVLCRIYEKNDRSPKAYTYGKARSPREALELDEPLDDFPHEGLPFEGEANNILDQYGGEGHNQFTSHGSYFIPSNQFRPNQNFQGAEYNYYPNYNTFVNGGIQASYYENNPEFYLTIPHQATQLQYINRTLLEAKQDPSLYFPEDNDILSCLANEMTQPLLGDVDVAKVV